LALFSIPTVEFPTRINIPVSLKFSEPRIVTLVLITSSGEFIASSWNVVGNDTIIGGHCLSGTGICPAIFPTGLYAQ